MNQQRLRDPRIKCDFYDLGLVDYQEAYCKQKQAFKEVLKTQQNILFFCEHPPVFTLGRLDENNNFLCSAEEIKKKKIRVIPVDRGGKITFHGPGQIVIYPIFHLRFFKKDLKFFVYQMEQAVIDFLKEFDIVANRFSNHAGVWIGSKKIASIGIGVRHWISYHGLCININTDLSYYNMIKPCGENVEMTSLSSYLKKYIAQEDAKQSMIRCFQRLFNIEYN